MFDYKYTEPSTRNSIFILKHRSKEFKGITFPGYIQMYIDVDSDVSWKNYSFELFDLLLDVPLVWEINQEYMAYCMAPNFRSIKFL